MEIQTSSIFAFLLLFITAFAIPVHGYETSNNLSIGNESIDKYAPEFRLPERGEDIPIERVEVESLENHSSEFNLALYSIPHGLINSSDPDALGKYSLKYNITVDSEPRNEITPIDPIEDFSECNDITASSVFVGFFDNLIERIKFW